MEKTILIAGKNMPEAGNFTEGIAAFGGRNIAVTGLQSDIDEKAKRLTIAERKANQAAYEEEKSREASTGICTIEWNRSSPLSARSLVLQTETIFDALDEAILYFDEELFALKADKMDSEEIARGCDEMILGYQYLALEILSCFKKRSTEKGPGTLVFLLKEGPSHIQIMKNPELKNGLTAIASPLVAAGAAAFSSFAENLAAVCADSIFINVVLIRGDSTSEGFRRDDETGKWVCEYLEKYYETRAISGKRGTGTWVRSGEKPKPVPAEPKPAQKKFRLFGR